MNELKQMALREDGMRYVEIDGTYGEGGGQLLRTALSLSCITGRPFKIHDIRAGRAEPGLKPAHILSARAAAQITGGLVSGAAIGSTTLTFEPGPLRGGSYTFDVGTVRAGAGSTGLVFQTAAPPLLFAPGQSRLVLKGGTHVQWAPPADYIKEVFLPALSKMGAAADFKNPVKGYYPIGAGEVCSVINPVKGPLKPFNALVRGKLLGVKITSAVSNLPESIAQRQLKKARERLGDVVPLLHSEDSIVTVPSPGRGTYIFILAEYEFVRVGFSALGALGKKAEDVGYEAAQEFIRYLKGKGALEPHLSDQMVLFMALADGESTVTATEVTGHLNANIYVIESFLPVKFVVQGVPGTAGSVSVKGCALKPGF